MKLLLWVGIPVLLVVAVLWWVDRRNPGNFRNDDVRAENQMEQRKDWGPR